MLPAIRLFSRAFSLAPFLSRLFSRAFSLAPFLSRLIVSLSLLMLGGLSCPADPLPSWNPEAQGGFITCLCRDRHGCVWVGTEDHGVWRWGGEGWTQFTAADSSAGPGDDDIYALCGDRRGRVWVGTLRHGVAVYNGRQWRSYGPEQGLAGSRVFALATCPTDGDVWIATEGGLTRYSLTHDTWRTYSRLDGLPSDAISCLAFRHNGDLYVGTQADGIAMATARSGYGVWHGVRGPSRMPDVPDGRGLPSALINCLIVAHDGSIYAGTDVGLARSRDGGGHWRFLRGTDWADMVKGEWHGPKPQETYDPGDRLSEDYVTALAEGGPGLLYVGHRRTGLDVFNEQTGFNWPPGVATLTVPGTDDVSALLPQPSGTTLIGYYGGGMGMLWPADRPKPVSLLPDTPHPPLPTPATPPTLTQMNALLRTVQAVPPDPHEMQPHAVTLDDDWTTQGDWLGRYGRYWADLCAFFHPIPLDYLWGAGWEPVDYALTQGPQHDPGDSLRYWLQWRYTDDPRVLEIPPTYLHSRVLDGYTTWAVDRRETEVDDHGENYDHFRSGLNIYATVTVPPGLYTLSCYEFNKDGHDGDNRFRDYRFSVRPHVGMEMQDVTDFDDAPEWAHGRVRNFWGGVWKRFLVRGPVTLTVEIGRNHSFNTILPAVMLDLADETPPPYFGTMGQWQEAQAQDTRLWRTLLTECSSRTPFHPARTEAEAADRLLAALSQAQTINSTWWAKNAHHAYLPLMRWYAAQVPPPVPAPTSPVSLLLWAVAHGVQHSATFWRHLGTCDYQLGLYPQWEECLRRAGLTPARDTEQALRWDKITQSNSGREFQVLTQFLHEQSIKTGKGVKTVQQTVKISQTP
jgi:hypothetical protein